MDSGGARFAVMSALAVLIVTACSAPMPPPVVDRAPPPDRATHYTVRGGDTLYAIAWRFGVDYRELASRNDIAPPYRIYPNQRLDLRGITRPRAETARRPQSPPRTPTVPTAPSAPPVASTAGSGESGARTESDDGGAGRAQTGSGAPSPGGRSGAPAGGPSPGLAGHVWQWPAQGRLVRDYGNASNAIDLELTPGSRVRAVAAGEVVYAGAGLRGFRHLVIIKHDSTYLSAYSINDDISVREGENVRAGASLATIAQTGGRAVLRFEIRRDGAPVNPRSLLDQT